MNALKSQQASVASSGGGGTGITSSGGGGASSNTTSNTSASNIDDRHDNWRNSSNTVGGSANMGGENSAFKAPAPAMHDISDRLSESSEEINVTTDDEEGGGGGGGVGGCGNSSNRTSLEGLQSPTEGEIRASIQSWREMAALRDLQPLQLTKYHRDRIL